MTGGDDANERVDEGTELVDSFFSAMDAVGALPPEHRQVSKPPPPGRPRPEDVERRLRTTDETLPYGTAYAWPDGQSAVMERIDGPVLELVPVTLAFVGLTVGEVAAGDPTDLRRKPLKVMIQPGPQPTELAVLDVGGHRRGAVVAMGDTGAAATWSPENGASGKLARLRTASGVGCLYDAGDVKAVKAALASTDDLLPRVRDEGLVALEHQGSVVGVAFDCGCGEGEYIGLRGFDPTGKAVAMAIDLRLHSMAVEVSPPFR